MWKSVSGKGKERKREGLCERKSVKNRTRKGEREKESVKEKV